MKRRVIVTGPDKKLRFGWWATRLMLWIVGLRGHYMSTANPEIPEGIAGIIIGGGDDIDPEHYGLTGDAGATYDPERDELEMRMARHAIVCDVPVLGICRGAQLINVVMGGSLFLDIREKRQHTPNRNSLFPIKSAKLEEHSFLANAMGKHKIFVNSLHNQAIDRIADNMRVSARDKDGFIQGVESADLHDVEKSDSARFILGVQWHPEYMPYIKSQRRLFLAFAKRVNSNQSTLTTNIPETML